MRILAIETSCDDTGIAVLEVSETNDFSVLSNIVSSQIKVHKKYGGVYPMLAKREHQRNLIPVLMRALKQAKLLNPKSKTNPKQIQNSKYKILNTILDREPELLKKLAPFLNKYDRPGLDLISVTNGPGLEPCLWVGVNFAKALSYFWNIPIVSVNHIESHILVNLLGFPSFAFRASADRQVSSFKFQDLFPAVALVVSGGHTQIVLVNGIGKYKILGETRDDAAGECFDKCAKILGLGYPGGPIISKLAENVKTQATLPRPMISTKDYDFSFSGLKTAVLYADRKIKNKTKKYKREMAAEVQQAIIDVLIKKTTNAAKNYKAKTIILGGGVSANQELRKQFKNRIEKELPNTKFLAPKPDLSTDNALMTAITGFFHQKSKIGRSGLPIIRADGNLRIK